MFDNLDSLSQFLLGQDEAYTSSTTFENTVGFLKFLAVDPEEGLSLTDEIVVIKLREGIFIQTKNKAWNDRLTALVSHSVQDYPTLASFPTKKLDDLIRNYRQPLDSFGDERLVRWKVGF